MAEVMPDQGASVTSASKRVAQPSVAERRARGRDARSRVPRSSHVLLEVQDGRDPVALLEAQAASRVAELVPIRYGRMLASPFAFFRGAAAVMAYDLAPLPRTGLQAQLCGDAHLMNFGGFASPERSFVFDLNDFDETIPGPFEWDVKRLAASFEVAGRDRGFDPPVRESAVRELTGSYRSSMREFAEMRALDVWYTRLDSTAVEEELTRERKARESRVLAQEVEKAQAKDNLQALAKLTVEVDGKPRIVSDPPLVVPIRARR